MAIEILGGKRNLNMNINAQQAILNAYILELFVMYAFKIACWALIFIFKLFIYFYSTTCLQRSYSKY